MSNVLVVGSGGREHAFAWKLTRDNHVDHVYTAPGNGGTSNNLPLKHTDFFGLASFASHERCLTLVGPEQPLAEGIVNTFTNQNLTIVGPNKEAAILEASKAWSKTFMEKHGIKTAPFRIFEDRQRALEYVDAQDSPLVVKADGLAAGKGVFVCSSKTETRSAIDRLMLKNELGSAGHRIVIEELLKGEEASFIVLSDGRNYKQFATSQDHKRLLNDDLGPNTGGMGAYSPARVIDETLNETIVERVIKKTLDGMRSEGNPFVGFLYAGLMIVDDVPYVLEFNVRSGDPETQPIIMRLKSDLYPYLEAAASGTLDELPDLEWRTEPAVCIVMSTAGYPGMYEKGRLIAGLDSPSPPQVQVFHAGTERTDKGFVTSGGRVLGITALGSDFSQATINAYHVARKISWKGCYYRTDIAKKALGPKPLTKIPNRG
ncbi:MAG: phosphoribosylamine--glycine ligase [Candidatus Bathyarchaeia archaeon]